MDRRRLTQLYASQGFGTTLFCPQGEVELSVQGMEALGLFPTVPDTLHRDFSEHHLGVALMKPYPGRLHSIAIPYRTFALPRTPAVQVLLHDSPHQLTTPSSPVLFPNPRWPLQSPPLVVGSKSPGDKVKLGYSSSEERWVLVPFSTFIFSFVFRLSCRHFLEAVAFPFELEQMAPMEEAIEDSRASCREPQETLCLQSPQEIQALSPLKPPTGPLPTKSSQTVWASSVRLTPPRVSVISWISDTSSGENPPPQNLCRFCSKHMKVFSGISHTREQPACSGKKSILGGIFTFKVASAKRPDGQRQPTYQPRRRTYL